MSIKFPFTKDTTLQVFIEAWAIPFFFRLLSNAFSDFGSVGRKKKKKNAKIKLENCLELGGPVPQHHIHGA